MPSTIVVERRGHFLANYIMKLFVGHPVSVWFLSWFVVLLHRLVVQVLSSVGSAVGEVQWCGGPGGLKIVSCGGVCFRGEYPGVCLDSL